MAITNNMFNPNRINLGETIPLSSPLVIQLETSGFCNLKCVFCPCGNDSFGAIIKDTMTPETFNLFLMQCKEFPDKIKALRIIGIGEPLMNKHLPEFVVAAKQSGIFEKVEITSNGVLLTPELSDALIAGGLDSLIISLEAIDKNKFHEICGVHVDLDKIHENLKYYYEHKVDGLLYIKTTNYAFELEEEKERFVTEYGGICDYIYVENVIENWPEFSAGTNGDSVRYEMEQYQTQKRVCVQPFKLLCLAANGDVMPCSVDWKRKLKVGNIYNEKLSEIWNGLQLRNLRISLLEQKICDYCKKCSYTKSNQPDDIDAYSEEILKRLEELEV